MRQVWWDKIKEKGGHEVSDERKITGGTGLIQWQRRRESGDMKSAATTRATLKKSNEGEKQMEIMRQRSRRITNALQSHRKVIVNAAQKHYNCIANAAQTQRASNANTAQTH
jgi:hypothetical protein